MNNVHPLISKLLNDWRQSASHPRQAKSDALVAETNQGIPMACESQDVPDASDDTPTSRGKKTEGTDRCHSLLN